MFLRYCLFLISFPGKFRMLNEVEKFVLVVVRFLPSFRLRGVCKYATAELTGWV